MSKFPTTTFSFEVLESKQLPDSFKEKITLQRKNTKKRTLKNTIDKYYLQLNKEEFSFEDMI